MCHVFTKKKQKNTDPILHFEKQKKNTKFPFLKNRFQTSVKSDKKVTLPTLCRENPQNFEATYVGTLCSAEKRALCHPKNNLKIFSVFRVYD